MQLGVFRHYAWRFAACHTSLLALSLGKLALGPELLADHGGKAGRSLPHFITRRRLSGGGLVAEGQEAAPLLDGC